MEKKDRGFVQISVIEYDGLKEAARLLKELLKSDKCIELSMFYSHDIEGTEWLINPDPDLKAKLKQLQEEYVKKVEKYWSIRKIDKRVSIFDIGKKISNIIS